MERQNEFFMNEQSMSRSYLYIAACNSIV